MGFPAVATTSNAIAATLGYEDGEAAPVEEMLAACGRIVREVSLPVTIDFERGYGLAPDAVVEAIAATGAVGLNNARTDAFLRRAGSPREQLAASIERGERYLAAGADCVYPIAAVEPDAIRALVGGIPGPVNVVYGRGALTIAELGGIGVARVSFGPALQRFVYGKFGEALSALAGDANPFAS